MIEPLELLRTVHWSVGVSLAKVQGPRQLLRALWNAVVGKSRMIGFHGLNVGPGHWEYFRRNWMHRDVSAGNVLLLLEAEGDLKRDKPVELFSDDLDSA